MNKQDLATEIMKISPPATVGSMIIAGVTLSDIILIMTGIYTVVQIYFSWRKHKREEKEYERSKQGFIGTVEESPRGDD